MAYKYREELVGKRFLSVSSPGKLKLSKISDWEWRAGVIRAATHKNPKNSELSVLVEFDDVEWKRREWIRVYEENLFQVFAIECTLVWLPRKQTVGSKVLSTYWPGVNYNILIDTAGLSECKHLPVEYLVDRNLAYVDYADLKPHQVDLTDNNFVSVVHNNPEVAKAIGHWAEYQDGQRILLTTPSVLVGYRVEVYRAEGTTQWYTAVIVSYNENTKELTLTDDTVLEEHNEDPSLVQMRLIGDGVVESILRGENIGITPRRRSCTVQHQQHLGHYTRTRSQITSQLQCHRTLQSSNSRKSRVRSGNEVGNSQAVDNDKEKEKGSSFVKDKKIKNSSSSSEHDNPLPNNCDVQVNKRNKNSLKNENSNCFHKNNHDNSSFSNNCNNRGSDLESENDVDAHDVGFEAVKASHHLRRRPKESNNLKNSCGKAKEVVQIDVPNSFKDSDEEEQRNNIEKSKSELKTKLKEKSSKEKKHIGRSQGKSNVRTCSPSDNNSIECERDLLISSPQRTKVKKCSVIVGAVERTSSGNELKRTTVDSLRSSPVLKTHKEEPSATVVQSNLCVRVESAGELSRDDGAAECRLSSPSKSPRIPDEQQQSKSISSADSQSNVVEKIDIRECSDVDSQVADRCSEQEVDPITTCNPQQQPQDKSVSDAGMSPVSYVKSESENVINGEQTRLRCTPTSSSSISSPLIINSADVCNNRSGYPVSSDSNLISMRDSETNRIDNNTVIKVRKVEEACSTRNSQSSNSLVLDPNEPVRIWRDPKLVGSDNSVFHITSVQHSTMAHPAGARSHSYSSGGSGGNGGGSSLQQSQHPRSSSSTSNLGLQSHFPQHMSPVPHPSMAHIANSPYLDHPQANIRIPSGGNPVVAPQPPPPPPQPSAPSPHQYPSHHPSHMLAQHLIQPYAPPIHNMDLVWQQKYAQPWMIHQFSDDRVAIREREAILREREMRERERQVRILDKERREHAEHVERAKEKHERMEQERRNQEKLEKEKLERERIQKEREKQQEMERLKKEKSEKEREQRERAEREQERTRREVQQHFEDSFRLAQYKSSPGWNIVPRQQMTETGGSSSTSSHHSDDGGRVSSRSLAAVHNHSHPVSPYPNSHKPADLSKESRLIVADSRYLSPEEQRRLSEEEKWSAMKRQQESGTVMPYNTISSVNRNSDVQQRSSSAHGHYPGQEVSHNPSIRSKQEYPVNPGFSPSPKSSSVPMSNSSSGGGNSVKMEHTSPNFNIYGYQGAVHGYMVPDRRGPLMATVPDNHKVSSSDLEPNRTTIGGPVSQSVNVPPQSHQRSGRCSSPVGMQYVVKDGERHRRINHGSVIVCGESVRHDNCKVASPIMSPKHQNKLSHSLTPEMKNSMYDSATVFKTYEGMHGQQSVSNDAHMDRIVAQMHPYGEPQNFHKSSATPHEPHHYVSRIGPSRSNVHQPPTPSSNYGPNVMSNISPPSAGCSKSATPVNYGSDLIQQGLVPNPIYNHSSGSGRSITQGASMHLNTAPLVPTSPGQKISKSSSQPTTNLPLPARSSPGVMYGKASIVAGTPLCRPSSNVGQSPVPMTANYSLHTPPPAHHNGGRNQPEHTRPASAHSQAPLPGPSPSHTATTGQSSHSPIDRSVSGSSRAGSSSSITSNPEVIYSSSIIPQVTNLSVNLPPHVPSPVSSLSSGGHSGYNTSSVSTRQPPVIMLQSPPQTQPLDLQAPDRHRENRSVSPSKRKSFRDSKDGLPRKRPKTVVMSVANEGLAAAVASVHQIMSNNYNSSVNGPRSSTSALTNVAPAPPPSATTPTSVITTANANTIGLDSVAKPTLTPVSVATTTIVSTNANSNVTTTPVTSPNKDSGYFNNFRAFLHSSQQNQSQNVPNYTAYPYGKHKGKHMAAKSNLIPTVKHEEASVCNNQTNSPVKTSTGATTSQNCATVSTPTVSCPTTVTAVTTSKPIQSTATQPTTVNSVSSEPPEKAISPALSNASSTSTCGTSIPKLKKEWLIRHSNEDGKNSGKTDSVDLSQAAIPSIGSTTITANSVGSAGSVILDNTNTSEKDMPNVGSTNAIPVSSAGSRSTASSETSSVNGHMISVKSESGTNDSNSVDNSEAESVSTTSTVKSGTKRKTRSNNRKTPKKEVRPSKSRQVDHNESNQDEDKDMDVDDEPQAKRVAVSSQKRRGRKPKSKSTRADAVRKTKSAKSSSTKMKQPTVARLKRTGESFLQKGPCCDVAPKLSKCRECRMSQHQRSKKMPNIFCRFYEFRRLKYTKNGFITLAGFSEPKDASEDDLKLWLPPADSPAADLKVDTSYFILTHVGDQFCDLVEQEREAQAMHMSEDKTIAWKRVVQGVREMCDVCETTLFNIHWACSKCGFVVCIDCYKARRNGTVKEEENPGKDRDSYSWLMCNTKQMHEQDKLMLTQIIAGNALWDMGKSVHEIRKKWQIANYCSCSLSKAENNNNTKKPAVNGLCKQLMSAVSKCFESDGVKESTNGSSEAIKKLSKVNNNVNGSLDYIKQEGVAGYNPDNSSPLSWLADVALNNSSVKLEGSSNKNKENHRDSKESNRQSPNYSSDTDDGKNSENYSTLRELLIRPTSKAANGSKNNSVISGKKKINNLDEVISHVIEQSVNNIDKAERTSKDAMKLMHYTKRFPHPKAGRDPLPIRIFTLDESKLIYPDVPHSWLCNGRLLRLIDPDHKGNLKLFQEQWKRGQPVLVSEINKRLDIDLWHPDSFSRDYGDKKNDLVNCSTGAVVPNQPMRKFWEGFESYSKRMKDENGELMLLKLKDWPPGDDFSEMLPSRFEDLMKALPLPEYTHRNGLLNIAGRLPECFVRPDLGPKMYNAYGSAMHPDKGTTNLHLDISDAVNVMVYVGIPKDSDSLEDMQEALRAIEEGGCDTITLRRVREKGSKPGALWHIYNARDADKIRDLLNKVAIERGETLESHHDPIHDQSWYLDGVLRHRLYNEYGVEGYAIAQCLGDAVFIPAGAPHQVRNLHSCIKVAEDFVSPENINHCFTLTQEFRDLSDTHTNHEDKLQVKNIIYHAVRDALALLMKNDSANYKDLVKSS